MHKLDTGERVFFYEQEFYVLSNFSAFRLQWDGNDFDTPLSTLTTGRSFLLTR